MNITANYENRRGSAGRRPPAQQRVRSPGGGLLGLLLISLVVVLGWRWGLPVAWRPLALFVVTAGGALIYRSESGPRR